MTGRGRKVTYEVGLVTDLFFYISTISLRNLVKDFTHPFYRAIEAQYPEQYQKIPELEADETFMRAFQSGDANTVLGKIVSMTRARTAEGKKCGAV